jgi:hypothetical protein
MRCWLLPAGSSLESMTELGVTPLALWGSAQVLMVLTSSSMVMARRANICSVKIAAQHSQSPCSGAPAPASLCSPVASSPLFWYFLWAPTQHPPQLGTPALLPPAAGTHPPPPLLTGPPLPVSSLHWALDSFRSVATSGGNGIDFPLLPFSFLFPRK